MTLDQRYWAAIRAHPFMCAFVVLAVISVIASDADKSPARKKLDFSRPIFTDDEAIICPVSLLEDPRADHDTHAIIRAFTAFTNRTEKAEALGCEVLRGGIPVKAHRMEAPDDYIISVDFAGMPAGSFFTLGGNLRNSDLPPEKQSERSSTSNIHENIRKEYEEARAQFQSSPSMGADAPMPNLRWFSPKQEIGGDSNFEYAYLLVPYGVCAALTQLPHGYSVISMDYSPSIVQENPQLLGPFSQRATAKAAAEKYCRQRYLETTNAPPDPALTRHLWFTPDIETEEPSTAITTPEAMPADTTPSDPGKSKEPVIPPEVLQVLL